MKNLFISFILVFFTTVVFSQDISLLASKEDMQDSYFSYFNGNSQFTYNSTFNTDFNSSSYNPKWKSEFTLIKYSSNDLSFIYKKNIAIPKENDSEVLPHSLIPIEEKIILFSTHYYKKIKKIKLIARTIDENGNLSTMTEVSEQENDRGDYCNFEINLSKDGKSIMIVSTPFYSSVKDSKLSSSIIILNKELRFIWNESLGIKYPCYKPNTHNKPYYNANKFYFLGYTESELDMNSNQVRKTFFCFDFQSKKLTHNILPIEILAEDDPYARMNYEIETNNKNQLILIALPVLSKQKNVLGAKPYFLNEYCFLFNDDLTELIFKNKFELPEELNGYSKFKVKNIFQDAEGGIYYITEHTIKNPPLPGAFASRSDDVHSDIIVNCANSNSNQTWTRIIKKKQDEYLTSYYSLISLFNGKEIKLVLNDKKRENESNFSVTNKDYVFQEFSKEKNAKTVILSIDKQGNITEDKSIIDFNNQINVIEPYFSFTAEQKSSIFIMKSGKSEKLGMLKFDKQ
jgi:hypothetical protein